ncbi:hypothetical protein CLV84_1515 [Neolewinella xylanilytica]|uniref:PemK-like, MazF-like toxin of type II toxin-antitoxin system n=1 Tax=Neolewinella xylanilytica TaxID=1514080 RepID=A0A2S6IAL7_9BACT|nr:hypothetical protein [Neolewinella xylanilytica]PPK88547.1 hypothetical protein CLV84_1515 [Neolewinella xylanilytica]
MPPFTSTFNRYYVYALRPEVPLPFEFVCCLSSTELQPRYRVDNVTFAPLIPGGPYADNDPFRVPLDPVPGNNGLRITRRMYVAVDALQTIKKDVFLPSSLGRVSATEEREIREKLAAWLGLLPVGDSDRDRSIDTLAAKE